MPNPVQQLAQQASDAVPGQRRVRLPWQRPTPAERTAQTLDTLAETAGTLGERLTQARGTAADRAADLASATRGRLGEIQARLAGQAAGSAGLVASVRERMRGARPTRVTLEDAGATDAGTLADAASVPAVMLAAQAAAASARTSAESATRAADATERATAAMTQVAGLLERLQSVAGITAERPRGAPAAGPTDVEIRVGEAAESPLARTADAVARAVAAAGEAVYDYSGGHYGIQPVDAEDLRREWKKEHDLARPIMIIEGHEAAGERAGGSRLPLVGGLVLVAGVAALAFWQRERLRPLATQTVSLARGALEQARQQVAALRGGVDRSPERSTAPTPTPAFDRVVRGELLPPAGSTAGVAGAAGIAQGDATGEPGRGGISPS